MENSLYFSKYLQKYFWGLLFSLVIISMAINAGKIEISDLSNIFIKYSGFVQGISLLTGVLLLSMVGLKTQDMLIMIIHDIFSLLNKVKYINKLFILVKLNTLFSTDAQLSKELFIKFSDDLLRHLYLKSWAQPEVLGSVKELDNHCKNVKEHILNLKDDDLMVHISYYHSISQENATKEELKNTIKEQYYILLNLILFCFIIVRSLNTIMIIVYFLIILYMGYLILKKALQIKNKLAYYILNGYIDVFTLGQGATIADRETNMV